MSPYDFECPVCHNQTKMMIVLKPDNTIVREVFCTYPVGHVQDVFCTNCGVKFKHPTLIWA